MSKCGKCKIIIQEGVDECVGCDYCLLWYHLNCAQITRQRYNELLKANKDNSLKWSCKKCTISGSQAMASQDSSSQGNDTSITASNFNELKNMLRGINSNVEKLDTKVTNLEQTFTHQFNQHMTETNTRIDNIRKDVNLNTESIGHIENELKMVNSQLHNLQRINNQCCLNFFGIPQSTSKDVDTSAIKKIAALYNIPLDNKSIQYCSRLSSRSATGGATARNKIPPLMVRFANREIAKEILDRYFGAERPLKLSDISDETIDSRVYIGEHLTQHALKIYRECSRLKYRKYLSKVYTRGGSVFVYLTAEKTAKSIRIDSMDTLRAKFPVAYDMIHEENASFNQISN